MIISILWWNRDLNGWSKESVNDFLTRFSIDFNKGFKDFSYMYSELQPVRALASKLKYVTGRAACQSLKAQSFNYGPGRGSESNITRPAAGLSSIYGPGRGLELNIAGRVAGLSSILLAGSRA